MRRVLLVGLLCCLAVLVPATAASAHNVLTSSTPAAGAVLATSPATVEFTFNAPIQESSYDTITITGPNRTHWAVSGVKVYGDTISATPGPFGPSGQYVLAYQIVSADSHPVSGQITVTLSDPGPGKPLTAQPMDMAQGGGVPAWVWLVGVVVIIGIAVIVLRRRRAPR